MPSSILGHMEIRDKFYLKTCLSLSLCKILFVMFLLKGCKYCDICLEKIVRLSNVNINYRRISSKKLFPDTEIPQV